MLVIKDFATTTLASALTAVATTITVANGSKFPVLSAGDYFYVVLQDFYDRNLVEVVKVTGVSGNVLTVVRGQDGTVGRAFAVGAYAELRLTVRTFAEFIAQSNVGNLAWGVATASVVAQPNKGYLVNAAGLTITLPSTPVSGQTVGIGDYNSGNHAVTIARNGSNIMGRAEDFIFNLENANVVFVYIDATFGWMLSQGFGESQAPYAVFNKLHRTNVLGQKTFPFASTAANTVDVYYNGWKLDPASDYTTTTTEVTLSTPVSSADDVIEIYGWNQALVLDASGITYDNAATGLPVGTMQQAVDYVHNSHAAQETELASSLGASLIGCKYGTLNVFMDRVAYAPAVGITTTNTPAQNTAALNAIRAVGGVALYWPSGTYQYDVYSSVGLADVDAAGKDLVTFELTGAASPVMFQPGPIRHKGIHFKSVAGSLEWSRTGMADYAVLEKCKISGFNHTSAAPNAWGCYFKNVKGCRLYNVEFDNNSQSDIAILEGTTDLIIEGCYSTSGNLVINFEPNTGTPAMSGIALRNMTINKLFLQNNDLSSMPDNLVRVEGCVVNELYYDGLGVAFSESRVNTFANATDGLSRLYGAAINGLKVSARELIPDPMLSNVGHTGSGCSWTLRYSTTSAVNRYNRAPTGEIVLSVNGVSSSTSLATGNLVCEPGTPYLFTICKEVLSGGTRPNIVLVGFKDSGGALIGAETYLARNTTVGGPDRHQHILVSPAGAAFVELTVGGGDTATVYQSVAYRYASLRKIENKRTGVDSSSVGFSSFPTRVKLPMTKAQFDTNQYYLAPLPVGTEVEFAYAAAAARLAKVTAQAADNAGKIGTLQIIANYP